MQTTTTTLFAAVAVPPHVEPFALAIGDRSHVDGLTHRSYPVRLAQVVASDVQDEPSAWDLADRLGADPTEAARRMFAALSAAEQAACRTDAAFFRAPEPATEEDAIAYWIEGDPDRENAAIRAALAAVGLAYVHVSPHLDAGCVDAIVRWVD
jgi:hypothetical protein